MVKLRGLAMIVVTTGVVLAGTSGSALAADSFVDLDTGDDANQGAGCPQADPCASVSSGIEGAGPGDTVHVDDSATAYSANNAPLFGGKSVLGDDWQGDDHLGRPVVQNVGAIAAMAVNNADSAGTIEGLTIRPNGADGLRLNGQVTAVRSNVFEDPGADGNEFGIRIGGGSPTIEDNVFTDLNIAVSVANGAPRIEGNEISGTRPASLAGAGVLAQGGSPTIVANEIRDAAAGATSGIRALDPVAAVELARNTVGGHQLGVRVVDTSATVTLSSDSITGATLTGLSVADTDDDGDAVVTATNTTVVAAAGSAEEDIEVSGASLTLGSSIVGDLGITAEDPGSDPPVCAINFSRGPVTGAGCSNFQTTADPQFAGDDDFHLAPGSSLIDAGNPAAPPAGTLDIDGEPRAVDGDGDCASRRDIGADEAPAQVPPPGACTPPPGGGGGGGGGASPDTTAPQTTIDRGPKRKLKSKKRKKKVAFEFSADEAGASFECSLDGEAFAACSSPHREKVKKGRHTFEVRARDVAGNFDQSPAEHSFKVKKRKKRRS